MTSIKPSAFTLVLLVCLSVVLADTSFKANILMTNVPGISGTLSGTIAFYYNSTSNYGSWKKIVWGKPMYTTEVYNYRDKIRNKICGSTCTSETYTNAVETLFSGSDPISTADPASVTTTMSDGKTTVTCNHYTRAGSLTDIWYNPSTGAVCQAKKLDGSMMYFSAISLSAATLSDFSLTGYSCPIPVCTRTMDIVLILDGSGSISYDSWRQMLSFSSSIAASYEIDNRKTTIGAVSFSNSGLPISSLCGSSPTFNTRLNSAYKQDGGTCLSCGLSKAIDVFLAPVSGRGDLNPSRVAIVMTDGYPNYYDNYIYYANLLKNTYNVLLLGIGVGDGIDMSTLQSFATPATGVSTAILASSFSQLPTILNKLISTSCTQLPAQDCTSCSGYCSCNKNCTSAVCPVSKPCLVSALDAAYGCYTYVPNCNDNDACTDDSCDPTSSVIPGCKHITKDCDDHNACTDDSCSKTAGCQNIPKVFPTLNKCQTGGCSTVTGWHQENKTCNDNNLCTVDSCDPNIGCVFTAVDCNDNNFCTDDACSLSTGKCVHTPHNCDDQKPCTIDTCPDFSVCQHTPVTCNHGEGDCYNHICIPTSPYTCNNTEIPYCLDHCKGIDCNAGILKRACMVGTCVTAPGGLNYTCNYVKKTAKLCNSGSLCIIDSCDPVTDTCSSRPVNCTHFACQDEACNPADGKCTWAPRDCPNPDPCQINKCNKDTDKCELTPVCPHQPCFDEVCNKDDPKHPYCIYTPRNCSSNSACIIDTCLNATDSCNHFERDCDDHSNCTIDTCDRVNGCSNTPKNCDDGKKCTVDTCDIITGCHNDPKCVDGKYCTDDYCNAVNGECLYTPIDCTTILGLSGKTCYEGACTEKRHCYQRYTESALLDVCGNCIDTTNPNVTYNLENLDNRSWIDKATTSCMAAWKTAVLAAALSAGAVAGIVIAVVIGAIVVLASGTFGTYELMKRASQAQAKSINSNPLYEAKQATAENPAFAGTSSFSSHAGNQTLYL